jgi:hypothetical protein
MIKIVAVQPIPSMGLCAIPERGDPISISLIVGNVKPGCFVEYDESNTAFYKVVNKNVKPPSEECEA